MEQWCWNPIAHLGAAVGAGVPLLEMLHSLHVELCGGKWQQWGEQLLMQTVLEWWKVQNAKDAILEPIPWDKSSRQNDEAILFLHNSFLLSERKCDNKA